MCMQQFSSTIAWQCPLANLTQFITTGNIDEHKVYCRQWLPQQLGDTFPIETPSGQVGHALATTKHWGDCNSMQVEPFFLNWRHIK
jgi:hypothetical protein